MRVACAQAQTSPEGLSVGNNPAASRIWGKIESMPYILEHLSSLRQEITDLRNMNARLRARGVGDGQIDQSAVEMRANRLARDQERVIADAESAGRSCGMVGKGWKVKPGGLVERQQFASVGF